MKKTTIFMLTIMFSLLLSACSLNEDAASLYKQETPLQAEIIIPETFSEGKETIKAVLTQNGKTVENAEFVHFEIWKQDSSLKYEMEQAAEEGNGTYSITKSFESDGLYYVKVHAGNNGSIIMPTKQFIVGELSERELKFLQEGARKQEGSHENHH